MAKDGDDRGEGEAVAPSESDIEKYRLFAEATEEGVVIHNYANVLAANSHFARMFGYAENRVEGAYPFAFIAPGQQIVVEEIARQNDELSGETMGLRADGSLFPIELIARPVIFAGHPVRIVRVRDLTHRKQVEAKLDATEERFRATFEQAAVGIAHIAVDGGWLRANQRLCDMVGYSREELLRLTFQDITHPDDLNGDLELFQAVIAGERDSYSMEKRYFRKNGSIIWINLTVAVVRLRDGSPSYFISMIEDISARKEIEETLRQSQKMEVVGQLTSSIAHDFGNFLNVIKGNLQILQLSELGRKNTEYVESALAGAELAEKLIRQLLSFSRRQELELEVLNIDTLIEDVGELLRKAINDQIDLKFDLQAIDYSVVCDRVQLETALFNLVLNARDAIGNKAGQIVIGTTASHFPEAPALNGTRQDGNYVCLTVRDSGHGMTQEILIHAIEPFFTTKASGEGTGLGLSQVAKCVTQMNGFVQIDSELGTGTTIRLFLPQRSH